MAIAIFTLSDSGVQVPYLYLTPLQAAVGVVQKVFGFSFPFFLYNSTELPFLAGIRVWDLDHTGTHDVHFLGIFTFVVWIKCPRYIQSHEIKDIEYRYVSARYCPVKQTGP